MFTRREIIKNEIKKLLSKEVAMYLIGVPLLLVLAFGYLYINRIGREYPIVVVDGEKNATSRTAIFFLESSPDMHVTKIVSSMDEGYEEMRKGDALAVVYLPKGLYKNVLHKKSQPAVVVVDCRNLIPANSILTGIAKTLGTARVGSELKLMEKYFPVSDRMQKILPLKVVARPMGNPSVDYFLFVITAFLILGIQQGTLIGSCMGIAKEREFNTLSNTIESSGGRVKYFFYRHLVVLAFITPIVFLASFLFFMVFSIPTESFLLSFLALILFTASVITFSQTIGTFFKRRLMVMQVLFFFALPAFFLSGYTYPVESIPPLIRVFAALLPTTPILNVFPRISYIEGSLPYLGGYILHQLALYLLYMGLSFIGFKKLSKKIVK